jgi:hypothetical protein
MRNCYDLKPIDASEIVCVTRVDGQIVCYRDRGDHCVIGSSRSLTSGSAQRCGDTTERTSGIGVERNRVEVGLGLLKLSLASRTLSLILDDERTYRELGKRDGRYEGFVGQRGGICQPGQQDDRRRIENAARQRDILSRNGGRLMHGRDRIWHRHTAHRRASTTLSISALTATGSTTGSARHRASNAPPDSGVLGRPCSCATAFPARVIVICSPRAARSTTSPP